MISVTTLMRAFYSLFCPGLMLVLVWGNAMAASTLTGPVAILQEQFSNLHKTRADYAIALERSGLSENERADYSAWIKQLADQVLQGCHALSDTELKSLPESLPCTQIMSTGLAPASINFASEHTREEQTETLVEQMNRSLGAFDEELLREQERVKARAPRSDSSSNGGGGDIASADQGEPDTPQDGKQANGAQQGQQGQQGQQSTTDSEQTPKSGSTTSGQNTSRGTSQRGTESKTPDDIPDGADDDVVARQLREAAEKETDPVLREKLWDEYRRYKSGTQ